jgi:hypothetical protein
LDKFNINFSIRKNNTVSYDKSIKIYDNDLNIIQSIENAHDNGIIYVYVRDENNFVTCSLDKRIKTWIKKENKFKLNKIVNNIDYDIIKKILYLPNNQIISCSYDNIIIWEKNKKKKYQFVTIINLKNIESFLLFENENLLIFSGWVGTGFLKINTYQLINFIKDAKSYCKDGMKKLDNNRIIIGEGSKIIIISITNQRIIKIINNVDCKIICILHDKNIFLTGGYEIGKYYKDITVFRNDNYKLIHIIRGAHEDEIYGFFYLKNEKFVSFSEDKTLKIWSL